MTRNLILHSAKIVVYVSITLVLLMFDSIWKGIRWFFEYKFMPFQVCFMNLIRIQGIIVASI